MSERNPSPRDFAEIAKALSRNPLGILGLFQVLTYAVAALVAIFATSFTPFQRNALTTFLLGFPLLLLLVFVWLVTRHSGKLFAPSDFRKDETFLRAVQMHAVVRAPGKLSEAEPAQEQVQLAIASAEVKTFPADEAAGSEVEAAQEKNEILRPRAEWKRVNYEFSYMNTLRTGTTENAEAISDAYLNTEQAAQGDNTVSWKAFRLLALVRLTNESKLDNFDELKRLAEANPRIAKVQARLASAYMYYGDLASAAGILQHAASETTDTDERARLLGRSACCAARAGDTAQAEQIIEAIKKISSGELQHRTLINSIRNVAESEEDDDTLIAVLERIVEDNPSDSDARFSLALKYSAHGERDMALIHYLRIPAQERSAAAWNNLGVEFDHWKLPAKAVNAFKTAEEMGETLAAANLADTLISAGFIEEARTRCDTAIKAENPHNNVSAALARVEEVPESENKTLAGITRRARKAVDFYKELAKAIVLPNLGAMAGVWNGPQCELSVTLEAKQFTAVGSYEIAAGGILGAFTLPAASVSPHRFTVEYHGRIRGRSISGRISQKSLNTPPPTLLSLSPDDPFRMVVAESGRELMAMEGQGNNRSFYVWKVKDGM